MESLGAFLGDRKRSGIAPVNAATLSPCGFAHLNRNMPRTQGENRSLRDFFPSIGVAQARPYPLVLLDGRRVSAA
jgi:hypothetical protein